jgi:hypothetical protein
MLVVVPMFLIMKTYKPMWICAGVFVVTSLILRSTWLKRLETN